jgi:U4/U6 small nuclear ribonucleoprotein PRP31
MSLADDLLADLDGLSDGEGNYSEDEAQNTTTAGPSTSTSKDANGDVDMSDDEGEGDEAAEGVVGSLVMEGGIRPAEELDAEDVQQMELGDIEDVSSVAKLEGSKRMSETLKVSSVDTTLCFELIMMQEIDKYQANPTASAQMALPTHSNPEYQLIVQANNLSVDVDNEILVVNKVCSLGTSHQRHELNWT